MDKILIANELVKIAKSLMASPEESLSATFNRFEISMTMEQAESCSHPGDCMADVKRMMHDPEIKRQVNHISPDAIRKELKEYGAWDEEELKDEEANKQRILWIAAGNIVEEN